METNKKNKILKINENSNNLKKFTIPKKRTTDTAYFEICHTDRREYSFIQSTLDESNLIADTVLNLQWKFGELSSYIMPKLEQRFADKRSKMREEGRRGKEIEENMFFLVTSHQSALKLIHDGLSVNSSHMSALGNPADGVYLHRHIDILLKYHQRNKLITKTILFFKVLLGKVRTIPPCHHKGKIDVKPTAKFDCHMSQIPASLKDPINIQAINSAVYLYEFNELCETMESPRHCLPYALVTVRFKGQELKSSVVPFWDSSAPTHPPLPEVTRLKSWTIAQRQGKGKNAKIVYQQYSKKKDPTTSPVQLSPSNSLVKTVTSSTNQDPRRVKIEGSVDNRKEHSAPAKISLPSTELNKINTLIKTICFLNTCSSLPDQYLRVNLAKQLVLGRTEDNEVANQDLKDASEDLINSKPLEVSELVMSSACGGSQSTPDSPAVTSEVVAHCDLKTVEKDDGFSSLTELNMKIDSDSQKCTFPSRANVAKRCEQPYFEDLNLYESEVKKKLRKYSEYLVLCDKDKLSKINSLERLSQVDKRAFYSRLKKYEKYYERYKNELGLGLGCNAVPSRSQDSNSLCCSNGSSGQDSKSCSCVVMHWGNPSGCSDATSISSGPKGLQQSPATLSDTKEEERELAGGSQANKTALNHVVCDMSTVDSGLSHNAMAAAAEGFDVCTENALGTSATAEAIQRSSDEQKTQNVSPVTKYQVQASPPSAASRRGGAEQSMQFKFPSAAHHSRDWRETNAELSDTNGTSAVSKGRINVEINAKNAVAERIQSSLGIGKINNIDVRSFRDSDQEEAQVSVTFSKYSEESYEKSPNSDPLLHFLEARIEWENLFETSRENELQINPGSSSGKKTDKVSQKIPPPAVIGASQLALEYTKVPDGEDDGFQTSSLPASARLPVSGISNLQITLSSGLNSRSYPDPALSEPSDQTFNQVAISGEPHRLIRSSTEGQRKSCQETAEKVWEVVSLGQTSKPVFMLGNSGLRETSQADTKERNTEGVMCENITENKKNKSEIGFHHTSNKTVLSCPDLLNTKTCMQTDVLCVLPTDERFPMHGHGGRPPNPIDHSCNMATELAEMLAGVQSDMEEGESSNEYHDTESIHRPDQNLKRHRSVTDNLCEESVLRTKVRKISVSKPPSKDLKKLNHPFKKLNCLEKGSKVTSNSDISLNIKRELCMNRRNAHKDNTGSVETEISSHTHIKEDCWSWFTDKSKAISCFDKNIETVREQNNLDSKTQAPVQSERCTKYVPHDPISSLDGNKRNVRETDKTTDNLYSLYKGRVDAFNQCQRKVAQALTVLSSEASFSKNGRLSTLLTHAERNLNKAFERVGRSSKILRRIGVPIFWESCEAYCQQHHNQNHPIQKNDSENRGISSKKQSKCLLTDVRQIYKGRQGKRCRRQANKSEQDACTADSVEQTSVPSIVVNSGVFPNPMQNKVHSQSAFKLESHTQITPARLSQVPLQPGERSTLAEPQVDCHLVSAKVKGIPLDPEQLESTTKSALRKSQMELSIDPQESRLCVWGNMNLETVFKFLPEIEGCFGSQKEEFLNKPQEEISPTSQLGKCRGAQHPMKPPSEQTEVQYRLQSQSEIEARTPSGKDQIDYCKHDSSDPISPCEGQTLDTLHPFKLPKFIALGHLFCPEPTQFQTNILEKTLLVDTVPQYFQGESPVIPFPLESKVSELSDLHQVRDNAITSHTMASELEQEMPCVELKTTEQQADMPMSNSQFEFSHDVEPWTDPQISIISPEMGHTTPLQVAVSHGEGQYTSDSQIVETQFDLRTETFQQGSSIMKFPKNSRNKSRNEDSLEMKRGEGEITSENGLIDIRVPDVNQKAGRVEDQKVGYKIRLPQNSNKAQQSGVLVAQLSKILQLADRTSRLESLERLKVKCERMLPRFIQRFEWSQGMSFAETIICREWFLRNGLQDTANAVHLIPSALEPYVELQMMIETVQFVENKVNFLTGGPRFRSLLWYDKTLYGDLLTKKAGYQKQYSLYPSFQERVHSSCLETLSHHQAEILKSCQTETRGKNAYYVHLKYKRELDEYSSVIQNPSDCPCFCLSVPVTSSVNYGDSLEDLEALHKHVWGLISRLTGLPKDQCDVAKLLHLWFIVDFVNGKTRFIHGSSVPNKELGWFGLEHLRFNAAKMLVWQNRGNCDNDEGSEVGEDWSQAGRPGKRISELNREALCLLYNGYSCSRRMSINRKGQTDSSQVASKLARSVDMMSLPSVEACIPEHQELGLSNCFQSCLHLLPEQFDSAGTILELSRGAQQAELRQLLLKCESQVQSLKQVFHVFQDVGAQKVLVTEANFSVPAAAQNIDPILLKPDATEIYIELVMMLETAHYLKNLMAHRVNHPTYRGMLWFDLSLLPELLHDQQDHSIFSFPHKECLQDSINELEQAISILKQELDVIFKYRESSNYSYAVQVLSRKMSEIIAVRDYMKQTNLGVSMFVNTVPYVASINYGNTETHLSHNYRQLEMLLERLAKVPEKNLGKMAHIMEAMKSIMVMKQVTAESIKSTLHILTYQMQLNSQKRRVLEDSEMVQKVVNHPDSVESGQRGTLIDGTTGVSIHGRPLTGKRKRQFCGSLLVPNGGEFEADGPTGEVRTKVQNQDCRS
ncbi:uncharacterized protein [Narcine bancroftii]|uniref:uncharacterized protein isoform X2 n=1 Tax=Narcine bancroftii TaxID=1343680 RepID=UPI0038311C03